MMSINAIRIGAKYQQKLMPNTILEKPWSYILVDFIIKLPLAQGYNTILVVCNWFSKMAYFIATIREQYSL